MKTHFKKMQNPDYLGSWDLFDKEGKQHDLTVTITKVDQDEITGEGGRKDIVMTAHLKNHKPFVVNNTNAKMIARVLGSPFIEDWINKSITLYVEKVRAFGDVHDALRVRSSAPKTAEKEELTPKHPKWNAAKKSIASGATSIDAIKKKYSLNADNEKLLTS